jgi:hypothetical protein
MQSGIIFANRPSNGRWFRFHHRRERSGINVPVISAINRPTMNAPYTFTRLKIEYAV